MSEKKFTVMKRLTEFLNKRDGNQQQKADPEALKMQADTLRQGVANTAPKDSVGPDIHNPRLAFQHQRKKTSDLRS